MGLTLIASPQRSPSSGLNSLQTPSNRAGGSCFEVTQRRRVLLGFCAYPTQAVSLDASGMASINVPTPITVTINLLCCCLVVLISPHTYTDCISNLTTPPSFSLGETLTSSGSFHSTSGNCNPLLCLPMKTNLVGDSGQKEEASKEKETCGMESLNRQGNMDSNREDGRASLILTLTLSNVRKTELSKAAKVFEMFETQIHHFETRRAKKTKNSADDLDIFVECEVRSADVAVIITSLRRVAEDVKTIREEEG
nr:uncharacterized protein LOC110357291 [Columba livia]